MSNQNQVQTENILVDKYNIDELKPILIQKMKDTQFIGLDSETNGLVAPILVGASLSFEDVNYYFDFNHAGNRGISNQDFIDILEAKPENSIFVAHNSQFDLSVFQMNLGYRPKDCFCTLILSLLLFELDYVSLPALERFLTKDPFQVKALWNKYYSFYKANSDPLALNTFLAQMISDGLAEGEGKRGTQGDLYSRLFATARVPKGLKQLVKFFFGHEMSTFEQTLNGAKDLSELEAKDVVEYGGEDAYWAVRLFKHLVELSNHYDAKRGTSILKFYQEVENPMVDFFVDLSTRGVLIDTDYAEAQKENFLAQIEKGGEEIRKVVQTIIPKNFDVEDCKTYQTLIKDMDLESDLQDLLVLQDKYKAKVKKAYIEILQWCLNEDDLCVSFFVDDKEIDFSKYRKNESSPLSSSFKKQIILYDLMGYHQMKNIKGKVSTDKTAIGLLSAKEGDERNKKILNHMTTLSSLSSLSKSGYGGYLTATEEYNDNRVHCRASIFTKTRRLVVSNPNIQNVPKRGEGSKMRKMIIAEKDCFLVSTDFSAIELVVLAEVSKDPKMLEAYAQIPHGDLHMLAGLAIAKTLDPDVTLEDLKSGNVSDILRVDPRNGKPLGTGADIKKVFRGELGKILNFNFWYSLSLARIASQVFNIEKYTIEERNALSTILEDNYKDIFRTAYEYQRGVQEKLKKDGFMSVKDGSSRYVGLASQQAFDRLKEALMKAANIEQYCSNDEDKLKNRLIWKLLAKMQNREMRKGLNSIQTFAGTVLKKSVINIRKELQAKTEHNWNPATYVAFTVHDEIICNVHKDDFVPFMKMKREKMCNHPELFKDVVPDVAMAVGINYLGMSLDNFKGQLELSELSSQINKALEDRPHSHINYSGLKELSDKAVSLKPESTEQLQLVKNYLLGEFHE